MPRVRASGSFELISSFSQVKPVMSLKVTGLPSMRLTILSHPKNSGFWGRSEPVVSRSVNLNSSTSDSPEASV